MRIRVLDLAELFGPAVHLRAPEFLSATSWSQLGPVRELWQSLTRLAEGDPLVGDVTETIFGGAIVLQQPATQSATLSEAIIIDGRHRLVAWQLLIDACRRTMARHGAALVARTLDELLKNPAGAARTDEQRFVVLPSRADRQEFIDRLSLDLTLLSAEQGERSGITAAHSWLINAAEEWLTQGETIDRAQRLARVITHRVTVIVIEARASENPLAIAQQLTTGGTPLDAVDIAGQVLLDALGLPDDAAGRAYQTFMEPFADRWWTESSGGMAQSEPRRDQLLRAWIISRTMRVVHESELAPAFQRYLSVSTVPALELLGRLRDEGLRMRDHWEAALHETSAANETSTFLYRMSVLGSAEAIAILLWLTATERGSIPAEQVNRALKAIESWVVRRVLTGLPHTGAGAGMQAMINFIAQRPLATIGDDLAHAMAAQRHDEHYWPTDDDLRLVLPARPVALEMPESAARVIVEAIAEHELGRTAVPRAQRSVTLLHDAPQGDADLAPLLRHVLANLALSGVWPRADVPVEGDRSAAVIEQCIAVWEGPPNAIDVPAHRQDDDAIDESMPWIPAGGVR